jgi:hypothetical protein
LESIIPTAAIVHGTPRCAYPASVLSSVPPLYPLITAGVMEVTGVGMDDVPAFLFAGAHCSPAATQSLRTQSSEQSFLLIGLLGWLALLGGFVALMRASGRGRSRWEILGACLIACTPGVADALIEYFHPENLLAMGFILAALAAATRNRWFAAGLLIGLACCAKQYALLAAVPLLVAVPRLDRWRFLLPAVGVAVVIRPDGARDG